MERARVLGSAPVGQSIEAWKAAQEMRLVGWRLRDSTRLLNGTGEQFFRWCILSPAAGFQNPDYAEDQNCSNQDTEQSPASRVHAGHKEEVTHWSPRQKSAFRVVVYW